MKLQHLMKILAFTGLFMASANPSGAVPDLPLLQQSSLIYKGAFRVPNLDTFNGSGRALAYNPVRNSLFIENDYHAGNPLIAEISIPAVVNTTDINALNRSTILQAFTDTTSGNRFKIGAGGTSVSTGDNPHIGGLLVDAANSKIIGSLMIQYDGSFKSVLSHYKANINWSSGVGFQGVYEVGVKPDPVPQAGFLDGYMTWIPQEWRTDFGGSALTGNGPLDVISRTSSGPAGFVFNPERLDIDNPVHATPLVYYPLDYPTLGQWSSKAPANNVFGIATEIRGVVFPSGTRSVLFFGRHGVGTPCYGAGTPDASEAATNTEINAWLVANTPNLYKCSSDLLDGSGGNSCCYDPMSSAKGDHAYPYVYRIWAYDALELLKTKNGIYKPWELTPYGVWNINFPVGNPKQIVIQGAAYDQNTQTIYIAQAGGDTGTYSAKPLIQVFQISGKTVPAAPTNLRR